MKKIRSDCPHCGERGKYVTYSDGHSFCHRCRKWDKGLGIKRKSIVGPIPASSRPIDALVLPDNFRKIRPGCIGWNYLRNRGIDPLPLSSYVGVAGRYIVFPIWEGDKLIYSISRKMYGTGSRYLNVSGRRPVCFVPYTVALPTDTLVVVEGIFDCIKICQQTNFPAISIQGKELIHYKIFDILSSCTKEVILMLDSETYTDSLRFKKALEPYRYVVIVDLPIGDPGSINGKKLRKIFKEET